MTLPESFLQQLEGLPGYRRDLFLQAHEKPAPVSIRIHPKKYIYPKVDTIAAVPWCEQGIYLSERPSFTLDPLFHAGCYYVQEASSMAISLFLKEYIHTPVKVLDLCAAPGGKSTLIDSCLPEGSLLVSNEVIKSRVGVLEENLTKWGAKDIVVTNNDPKDFEQLPDFFDVIVVDAPCSGSGLFRKDAQSINEWSEDAVNLCASRQQRIIHHAWKALKPGGLLIYATCSFSPAEDEALIEEMMQLGMEILPVALNDSWGIMPGTNGGYRFWPHRLQGEGFFMAALRKSTDSRTYKYKEQIKWTTPGKAALEQLKKYVTLPEGYTVIQTNDDYILFPQKYIFDLAKLAAALYIRKSGVKLGRMAGKDFIPDPELAWAALETIFPKLELDHETALQYLRKQPIAVDQPAGWYLVTHQHHGLGWIKVMPGRSNNYYPKDWRILK